MSLKQKLVVLAIWIGCLVGVVIIAMLPAMVLDLHSLRKSTFSYYWMLTVMFIGSHFLMQRVMAPSLKTKGQQVFYWVVFLGFAAFFFWFGIETIVQAHDEQKYLADFYLWLLQKTGRFIDCSRKE